LQRRDPSTSVQFVAAPIMHNGKIAGVVSVSKPQTSIQEFMEHTQQRINFLGTIAALGVVAIGTIFSAWLTYPIRNLTKYAKAIRDGRRVKRPNMGHSEIRTLGMAFEEMRDALEGKDYVHRYVQTLTHEIKSPVAAIQGAAELLEEEMPPEQRRRFLSNIQSEAARIKESVDSMLLLSSVESKKSLDCVVGVDLCEVVVCAETRMMARADLKSVRIVHELPPSACLRGDPLLLEKTVNNLIENAVAFSPSGGAVHISVTSENGCWVVSVEDSGPGIPEFALSRVCDRFYSLPRPDTGKKSSGLGLAFVREVAVLHGGSIELRNRPEGGAQALLRLPG
jgi:two-component system sensor histidine kinase CreC